MQQYEGSISIQENGKYLAVILKVDVNKPNSDTIMEKETYNIDEASIWVDDELSRLITGKGVWNE